MSRALRLVIVTALTVSAPTLAHAQPSGRSADTFAITSPAEADADYHYQGEYSGYSRGRFGVEPIGLQVVALGAGQFQAMAYRGGLPGQGGNNQSRETYYGAMDGNFL